MTVGGLADTVFCFSRPCECHLYTAPRNRSILILNHPARRIKHGLGATDAVPAYL
jgi:hypothetical protein